ncbi:MAG TPA: response regulator transcription factor [Cellvibrio sp.]
MPQLFVAPASIHSPHWLQAFPDAQVVDSLSHVHLEARGLVWLLLGRAQSFTQIQTLSADGFKVIAMTAIEQTAEARSALEAGASGYVHYLAVPSVLEQIAQSVAAGGAWLGADLMRQLILGAQRLSPITPLPTANLTLLTSRERAVAELVAAGKTNKEVARELDITERTVKAHLGASFEKLGVRDRLQLALALSSGIKI